ncbi:serine protease [Acuticoccus sediminis]|uniref:Serine protease n=1 Tax=Acuticoccus sediminis TaxID=2184697 RepID=A0A8B2NSR6_9HYPH|nr:Do family serine endopeptidase [Acuticoccus sediminis]RAH99319.1 serine protease [Acuticoccus sediminis]
MRLSLILPALAVALVPGVASAETAVTPTPPAAEAAAPAAPEIPQSRAQIALSFAPVVRQVAPAVVNVYSMQKTVDPFYSDDPFLRRFFGRQQPRGGSALGSGVIVDPSGLMVTNAHVIKNASEIRVGFNDRREADAKLLLRDARSDLAVLQIEGDGPFPTIPFAPADELETGDLVLAIGNPFGVGQTVTQGIVSATARTQVGVADQQFFIQTDAAINPGNSGGGLIDMAGRLVGINSAIYSRSGGSNGIGFAIPAETVRLVVEAAKSDGVVHRPWLGAKLENVTRELARQLGLDRPAGAVVVELSEDGPARRAGIRVADVITAVDGVPVTDIDSFSYAFATRGTEGETEITFERASTRQTAALTLERPPESEPRDTRRLGGRSPFAGATVQNLSPAVADELNIDMTATGVVIARVNERTPAARFGLRPGDIVRSVNGNRVETTEDLERMTRQRARYWDLDIERDGRRLSVVFGG